MKNHRIYTLSGFRLLQGIFLYILVYQFSIYAISTVNIFTIIIGCGFLALAYKGTVLYMPTVINVYRAMLYGEKENLLLYLKSFKTTVNGRVIDIEKEPLGSLIKTELVLTIAAAAFAGVMFFEVNAGIPVDRVISYELSRSILNGGFVLVTVLGVIRGGMTKST